jgi:hypothetical protein
MAYRAKIISAAKNGGMAAMKNGDRKTAKSKMKAHVMKMKIGIGVENGQRRKWRNQRRSGESSGEAAANGGENMKIG